MTSPTSGATLSGLVPALSDEVPGILAEVVELLRDEWPEYAVVLAADTGEMRETAEVALRHLVTLAERMSSSRDDEQAYGDPDRDALFEELGRIEWREGRALGTLLSAYRAGARAGWRRLSRLAVAQGLDGELIAALAEAIFVFVEELSSASARGYVEEQRATTAERERLRSQLAELLLSDRSESAVVAAVALQAGWPVPATAALVLVDPDNQVGLATLDRLHARSLPLQRGSLSGLIISDPAGPGRRAQVTNELRDCGAVVGVTVPTTALPATVATTEAALRLARAGHLEGNPVFVEDHLDAVLVHRDRWLLDQLRSRALTPLAALAPATAERLADTLASWLAHHGDRRAVADELGVHPQTVRYRMRQVEDLFGPQLEDAAARRRLTLALCWGPPAADPRI